MRVYLSVPNIDTEVYDLEVLNFNKKATELEGATTYAVSLDLPFAQARWCAAGVLKTW